MPWRIRKCQDKWSTNLVTRRADSNTPMRCHFELWAEATTDELESLQVKCSGKYRRCYSRESQNQPLCKKWVDQITAEIRLAGLERGGPSNVDHTGAAMTRRCSWSVKPFGHVSAPPLWLYKWKSPLRWSGVGNTGEWTRSRAAADSEWPWCWRCRRLIGWPASRPPSSAALWLLVPFPKLQSVSHAQRDSCSLQVPTCVPPPRLWLHPPLTPSPVRLPLGEYIEQEEWEDLAAVEREWVTETESGHRVSIPENVGKNNIVLFCLWKMEKTGKAGLTEDFKSIGSELVAAIWSFPSAEWNQPLKTQNEQWNSSFVYRLNWSPDYEFSPARWTNWFACTEWIIKTRKNRTKLQHVGLVHIFLWIKNHCGGYVYTGLPEKWLLRER